MTEYTSFIKKILLACFIFFVIGIGVIWGIQRADYIVGWLWGHLIVWLYIVLLAYHSHKLQFVKETQVIRVARTQMGQRLLLVISMILLGMKVPMVNSFVVVSTIAITQPVLYVIYWRLSR